VLYDAVAVLASADGLATIEAEPAVRDFLADAYAHYKFIGYTRAASDLIARAAPDGGLDEGCLELGSRGSATAFLEACRKLRYWDRAGA
jgi:catalase